MSQIIVMVKTPAMGILIPCVPRQEPDGVAWQCAMCRSICCRVSFGQMHGFWRCRCGCELDIIVDGHRVDLSDHKLEEAPPEVTADPAPVDLNLAGLSDEDFMKSCGITAEEPHEPEGS